MLSILYGVFVLASCVNRAAAWGALGHETIGYVAQQFLAPKALAFVQSSLGSTYNSSLGPAATWADNVKYETAYEWSAPLHFVDAEDSPLTGSCSVSESRDCGDGECILTAIANYTTRVAETSLSATQRQEALKFLDHFLGDIGQPLHVEAYEVGGNDISAKCSGSSTNLHAAWDTGLVEKNIDSSHGGSPQTYASDLTGSYKSLTSGWLSCTSTTDPASKRSLDLGSRLEADVWSLLGRAEAATITPLAYPLVWAKESNAYDCSVVFGYTNGEDLCTSSYFTQAVPVIDLQIAKQGYRLAAWLNVIFDGATNLPSQITLKSWETSGRWQFRTQKQLFSWLDVQIPQQMWPKSSAADILQVDLGSTLGAAFLGFFCTSVLYGITSLQTFTYFTHSFKDDFLLRILLRRPVCSAETDLEPSGHDYRGGECDVYATIVSGVTQGPSAAQLVTNLIVRGIFGLRIWRLSGGHWFIPVFLVNVMSLYVLGDGIYFAVRGLYVPILPDVKEFSWSFFAGFGTEVVADAIIAISQCILLMQMRTGIESTDSIVSVLIRYSINPGLLTSICAVLILITYTTMPAKYIYFAFYFVYSKCMLAASFQHNDFQADRGTVYVNSLLATLNARATLLGMRVHRVPTEAVTEIAFRSGDNTGTDSSQPPQLTTIIDVGTKLNSLEVTDVTQPVESHIPARTSITRCSPPKPDSFHEDNTSIMSNWIDFLSLVITLSVIAAVVYGLSYIVRQTSKAVQSTKDSFKAKGVHISKEGVSVKTSRRLDRESEIDAAQRGFIKAMKASSGGRPQAESSRTLVQGHDPLPGAKIKKRNHA
ncbi:Nuclease PA3 [Grifola frondosa]|uniref:Nuclease PA3 n=1 Tax=Grifola frondosa TaxID=5627 RepID=A0A1C7M7T2_GRIFR|nr:Nuclease PA3 [Grifola frondosa]